MELRTDFEGGIGKTYPYGIPALPHVFCGKTTVKDQYFVRNLLAVLMLLKFKQPFLSRATISSGVSS